MLFFYFKKKAREIAKVLKCVATQPEGGPQLFTKQKTRGEGVEGERDEAKPTKKRFSATEYKGVEASLGEERTNSSIDSSFVFGTLQMGLSPRRWRTIGSVIGPRDLT